MTSPPHPTLTTRVLDAIFGKKLTGAERESALAVQPPGWVRRAILLAYGVCLGLTVFWGVGALGWLPMPRQGFTISNLSWISGFGIIVGFATDGIERHYRRRAERAAS